MKMIAEGGFNSIRDECMWCVVEERKGEFKIPPRCLEYIDSALSYGLLPLMILDYSNPNYDGGAYPESESARAGFAAYSSKMAAAFKGKIKLWQVWNEWDGGCGMPAKFKDKKTMEGYAKLLKASAAEVSLRCLAPPTLVSGAADAGAVRLFTSTKCSPPSLRLMMSTSRWRYLQFLATMMWPSASRWRQASSSPLFPMFRLESFMVQNFTIVTPVPPLRMSSSLTVSPGTDLRYFCISSRSTPVPLPWMMRTMPTFSMIASSM